jgi:hypothetical protein
VTAAVATATSIVDAAWVDMLTSLPVSIRAFRALPQSEPAFPSHHVQLETDVLRQSDESRAPLLDPQQRVHAHRIGRREVIELEDRRVVGLTGFQQIGYVRFSQTTGQTDDKPAVLAPCENPTGHNAWRGTQETVRRVVSRFYEADAAALTSG